MFAAPDDVTQIDEASALSLVVLGPSTPHSGRAATPSAATDAVSDALTRCRASQRRFRNTLIFVAADEGLARDGSGGDAAAMAWADIAGDERLQKQLTQSQAAAAKDSAKTSKEGAARAVRNAWSHILFPVKTDATEAGKAFELEHLALSAKDKGAIPAGVYEKARADGVVLEKLGPDTLWLKLRPLWAEDRPHIAISEIADWFASYVYLPKVRDRVVLETSIRDAIGKFDAAFGYAERFDAVKGRYEGLICAKTAPEFLSPRGGPRSRRCGQAADVHCAFDNPDCGHRRRWPHDHDDNILRPTSVTPPPPAPTKPRPVLWLGRNRHEPPCEGVRHDPQFGCDGVAAQPGREGQADIGDRGRGSVGVQRRGCRRGAR